MIRISNNNNELSDSTPCAMCINMMKENGIKKVYYSNSEGEIECQKVDSMIESHISYGTARTIQLMTPRNRYLIFGKTIDINKIMKRDLG